MNSFTHAVEQTSPVAHNSIVTTPAPRAVWEEIYQADPTVNFHQSPLWVDYVCAAGGFTDVSRLYEFENGKRLVLPLVKRKGVPAPLAVAESFPYAWGIGGLLAWQPLQATDIETIAADLASTGYLGVSVRPNPLQGDEWAIAKPAKAVIVPRCAHVLDLSGGFDHVWAKRFTSRTRNHVRRAEKSGLHIECDTTGRLIPTFYELFERSLERWAATQHEPLWLARLRGHARDPQEKLQKMAQMLGDKCRVWVAWHEGRPAAASLTLCDKNYSSILSVSDKELSFTNANYLIKRLEIEEACQAGSRYYDFGETGFNERLAHYKSGYGAVAYPYADYHFDRVPITQWDHNLRGFVKGLIGFKDV